MARRNTEEFRIDSDWNFDVAARRITERFPPSGYANPIVRHQLIRQWGAMVGRERAVRECDDAIRRAGSRTALAREIHMNPGTLRDLREYYSNLPLSRPPLDSSVAVQEGFRFADRFNVVEFVTDGGMGRVYRTVDEFSGTRVVLKHCLEGGSPENRRRFAREVKAMASVRHPNVMPVLFDGTAHDPPFFVMPEASGRLDEEIGAHGNNWQRTASTFVEICRGVQAIHTANEIHRDLKPLNILRVGDRWVVSDLGLVAFFDNKSTVLTRSHELLGTEGYIAPECRSQKPPLRDRRVDIYSLGKLLYVMSTGADAAYIDETKLPTWARETALAAAAENPARRPATVPALWALFEQELRKAGHTPTVSLLDV